MKICIAGKNNIAVDVLQHALKYFDKKDICIIPNKNDTGKNKWQKSLLFYAKLNGVPVVELEMIYTIPDLVFLSLEYDTIIRPDKFLTKHLFNIHFSLLPAYKGMYTSLLPILNGEKKTGVTLHRIDSGIDTGEIIYQNEITISEETTGRKLYFNYLKEGANLVIDNFQNILNDRFKSSNQPIIGSTYYSKYSFDLKNKEVNVNQTAYQILRNCNALIFREYQMPLIKGNSINRIQLSKIKSTKKSGSIIEEDDEKIILASIDYDIVFFKDYYSDLLQCSRNDDISNFNKIKTYISNFDEKDENGWTPLIVACYNGSIKVAEELLRLGADPNLTNLNGTTPLMFAKDFAINSGNTALIILLKKAGAITTLRDIYGKSVIDYLYKPEHDFIVQKITQ
jgi:methionyl-tRNA formyltransferase